MSINTITLARLPIREYGNTGGLGIDANRNGSIGTQSKDDFVTTAEPILGISSDQLQDYFRSNRVNEVSLNDVGEISETSLSFNVQTGERSIDNTDRTLSDVAAELNPFPNHPTISDQSPVEWTIRQENAELFFLITTGATE